MATIGNSKHAQNKRQPMKASGKRTGRLNSDENDDTRVISFHFPAFPFHFIFTSFPCPVHFSSFSSLCLLFLFRFLLILVSYILFYYVHSFLFWFLFSPLYYEENRGSAKIRSHDAFYSLLTPRSPPLPPRVCRARRLLRPGRSREEDRQAAVGSTGRRSPTKRVCP